MSAAVAGVPSGALSIGTIASNLKFSSLVSTKTVSGRPAIVTPALPNSSRTCWIAARRFLSASSQLLWPDMIATGFAGSITSSTLLGSADSGTRVGRLAVALGGGAGAGAACPGAPGPGGCDRVALGGVAEPDGAGCGKAGLQSSAPVKAAMTRNLDLIPTSTRPPRCRSCLCPSRHRMRYPIYDPSTGLFPQNSQQMSPLANRRYLKMNGLGNEIVVVDLRGTAAQIRPDEARAVAANVQSRFDQLMAIRDTAAPGADAYLEIYNTDGSLSGSCGNGTRCVAWAMLDDPIMARPAVGGGSDLLLETQAGLITASRVSGEVFTVDMGVPRLAWNEIP